MAEYCEERSYFYLTMPVIHAADCIAQDRMNAFLYMLDNNPDAAKKHAVEIYSLCARRDAYDYAREFFLAGADIGAAIEAQRARANEGPRDERRKAAAILTTLESYCDLLVTATLPSRMLATLHTLTEQEKVLDHQITVLRRELEKATAPRRLDKPVLTAPAAQTAWQENANDATGKKEDKKGGKGKKPARPVLSATAAGRHTPP